MTVVTIVGTALGTLISIAKAPTIRGICIFLTSLIVISNFHLFWKVPHQALSETPVLEPLIPSIRSCMTNRPFKVLFAVIAIVGFCGSLSAKIQSFFAQEIFHVSYKAVQSASLIGTLVLVVGVSLANAITPRLIQIYGLKRIMIFALLVMGFGQILWFFMSYVVSIYAFFALASTTLGFGMGKSTPWTFENEAYL